MTSGYSSTPAPFINKGLVQKHDPSQLGPGEYYFLENATSQQEGALTIRTGHEKLTSVGLSNPIVSLSKLNLGGPDNLNPRYRGSGANIYRDTPTYPANTSVTGGVTLTSGARWSAQQYNAGASGTPALYLATPNAALRDGYAPGSTPGALYTTLQKWGIDPPPVPVQVTPNIPFVSSLGVFDSGGSSRFVPFGSGAPNSNSSGAKQIATLADGGGPQVANVAVTAIAFSGGHNTVTYTPGLFTPTTGEYAAIVGSTTAANDGVFQITGTGTNTFTVTNASGVSESETATAYLYQGASNIPPGYVTFTPIPAVSSATVGGDGVNGIYAGMLLTLTDSNTLAITNVVFSAGNNTYSYTGTATVAIGEYVTVAGCTTPANDGTFPITATGSGTFTVANTNGVSEAESASANFNEIIVVLAVDTLNFYAVTVNYHLAFHCTVSGSQISGVTTTHSFTGLSIDASFNGTAVNGYSTDDNFHIALQCTNTTAVTNIQIQVVPDFSGSGPTNYYYYNIVPSASMSSSAILTDPAWVEFNIPKSSFLTNGSAGAGVWTWKNITQVIVVVTGGGGGNTVNIGNVYFIGGGGLNSIAPGTTAYDWLYTYRNPTTQQEGNPCPLMITPNLPPPINNGQVTLTLTGTVQAAVTANGIVDIFGPGSIAVYRRGGTFSDGLYRLIGYSNNPFPTIPGVIADTVTFIDNASDQSLDQARTLQFDNDPPVPSNLPTPLTASIAGFVPRGGGAYSATSSGALYNSPTHNSDLLTNGIVRMVLADSTLPNYWIETGSGGQGNITKIASIITIGSTIQVGFGSTFEQAIVTGVGYDTGNAWGWIECWLQYNHGQSFYPNTVRYDASDTIEIDAILRGNCDLVHQDFDCVFLAGDPNNPATLYQSKVGRPESFPVINLENNFIQQATVGSPSNPINGVTSIGPGELVCLNYDNIFIVQVWAGQMQQPIQAPATRGLYSKWCWCKGDNRIWYLSYDGVYTWAGGQSQKVSEAIDFLFTNQTVNGIAPIDMTQAANFTFAYARNSLYISYVDTAGGHHRLRFESLYSRWTIETIYSGGIESVSLSQDCLFTEPDTGNLLVTITDKSHLSWMWLADFYSTTDGWSGLPTSGTPITYNIQRYWSIGDMGTDYQVGEFILEMANASDAVGMAIFYNYGTSQTTGNVFAAAAGALPNRGRFISTVNNGTPMPAYSIGILISGSSGAGVSPVYFYTFEPRALKLEQVTTGPSLDWDDLGYPYDKFLFDVVVQYDTGGQSIEVALDTINGVTGNVENLAVATYTISGSQRSQRVFVVPDQTVAKMIRLRPINTALTQFKWWKYQFRKLDYPPDVVESTAWEDDGYLLPKYAQEIMVEVDTGGSAVQFDVQADGASVQTVSVLTKTTDRHRNITLNPNLQGKQWRIVLTPTQPTVTKFQLFQHKFQFQPVDKGPVSHTFDYDDLGHPFDKLIQTVTFEFDTSYAPGTAWTINMDTLTGIDGNILTVAAQQFVIPVALVGGRGKKTFAINPSTIVKMVRMYPVSDTVGARQWKYTFTKVDYPADTILATDWSNSGYGCDKTFKWLKMQVDTGGVIAVVQFQMHGAR